MMSHSKSREIVAKVRLRVASAQISKHRIARSRGSSAKCLRAIRAKVARKSSLPVNAEKSSPTRARSRSAKPTTICLLGGEVAVEVAGAHARFGGHVLHGRAVEPAAHEAAFCRIKDSGAPIHDRLRLGRGRKGSVVHDTNENERSFSRTLVACRVKSQAAAPRCSTCCSRATP